MQIIDRYGNMPKEIENLLEIARIKICVEKKYNKKYHKTNKVIFYFMKNYLIFK